MKRKNKTKKDAGSLVAISIHSLADYNLHFMANMFMVVVLAGIGIVEL